MSSMMDKVKIFFGFEEEDMVQKPVSSRKEMEPKTPVIRSFRGSLIPAQSQNQVITGEIKIEEPRIYEDSLNIATYLRESKPVIVNLKYLDNASGKRLIDFVCGTAYAINGHMMKIGENIFLFTPENFLIVDSDDRSTFEQGLEEDEKETFFKRVAFK